ncbi:MAG: DUF4416 family protein [Spirochaetales bacterium]|nr:DUF4416 family protein [Spirochaetales bacterium]
MGNEAHFYLEKLVLCILESSKTALNDCRKRLIEQFGVIDFESEPFEFTFSDYYNNEMGTPIRRMFLSFEKLIKPEYFAQIKTKTNQLETLFAESKKRKINLDPGLLNQSRFILASTKDSSHRIPLADGIFAEITLMFEKKTFRPVEWTYIDYKSPHYIEILNKIRGIYREQVKAGEHIRV